MNMYYNEVLLVTTTEGLTNTGPYNHCFFIARIKSNELGRFRLEMMCPPKQVEKVFKLCGLLNKIINAYLYYQSC